MGIIESIIRKIKWKYGGDNERAKILRKQGMVIGKNCEIYPSAGFGSEPYLIKVGNHVRVNSGVKFVTHDGGCWVIRELDETYKDVDIVGKIVVGNNVHIGTDAIIMPGVIIGDNSIVGCSSVVTKSFPPNSVIAGIPARRIESVEKYIEKNKKMFVNTKKMSNSEKKNYLLNENEIWKITEYVDK